MTRHLELSPLVEKVQQRTRERHDDIVLFMHEIAPCLTLDAGCGMPGALRPFQPSSVLAVWAMVLRAQKWSSPKSLLSPRVIIQLKPLKRLNDSAVRVMVARKIHHIYGGYNEP